MVLTIPECPQPVIINKPWGRRKATALSSETKSEVPSSKINEEFFDSKGVILGTSPRNKILSDILYGVRTTSEKIEVLKKAGFTDFSFAQTLTRHPVYSDSDVEEPKDGYDRGDYVAICAYKK